MLIDMSGKWAKNGMGVALGVYRPGEALMESLDSHGDGAHTLLRGIPGSPGVFLLELVDFQQLPLDLGFHWIDLIFVVEDCFQLKLLTAQDPESFCVVESEVPLLNDLDVAGTSAAIRAAF